VLKTMCCYAPILAVGIAAPYVLLAHGMVAMGLDADVLAGPMYFCLSYGPYAIVYWVIKRDFERSVASRLPLLPIAEDGGDKRHGWLGRWLEQMRHDVELDAILRRTDGERAGGVGRCACMALALCVVVLGIYTVAFAALLVQMRVDGENDSDRAGTLEVVLM
jgi:hypothetical protein